MLASGVKINAIRVVAVCEASKFGASDEWVFIHELFAVLPFKLGFDLWQVFRVFSFCHQLAQDAFKATVILQSAIQGFSQVGRCAVIYQSGGALLAEACIRITFIV